MARACAGAILSIVDSPTPPRQVAAIDLGSNSFHMVVAEATGDGDFRVIDRIRHRVRLAAGLDDRRMLAPDAQARALDSLAKMGQRLQLFGPNDVRAVGTNTFRKARNGLPFLVRCSAALGHRIDIISGREEARLVFGGVRHGLPDGQRSLVVDIGGGSTEVIIGEQARPLQLDSLYMGCVSYSERFFGDGRLTKAGFKAARVAAGLELAPIARRYRDLGWARAVGSSGTVRALAAMSSHLQGNDGHITPRGLAALERQLLLAGHVQRLRLPGLSENRRPVIAGGLAILQAVFAALEVEQMRPSNSALREGVLLDLLGRGSPKDRRARAVRSFATQFGVDAAHASRVTHTALQLFDAVEPAWRLSAAIPDARRLLEWAAQLHEVGLVLRWSGHHKHGRYLIENGDLPGFSRSEQATLATLVLGHRGRLSAARLQDVSTASVSALVRLCVPLRLAHRLQRERSPAPLLPCAVTARGDQLTVEFDAPAEEHPLTRADLEAESAVLESVGVRLAVRWAPQA